MIGAEARRNPMSTQRTRWPMPSRTRALLVAAMMIALLLWAVWPTDRSRRPVAPVIPTPKSVPASPPTESAMMQLAGQIVDGNVFSSTRRAPTARFVPPGSEPAGAPVIRAAMIDGATSGNMVNAAPDSPRLFGIVAQDGRRRALLQLPGADSVPKLLDIGDRRGGYRVVSISDDRVVLATSTGSRTLRLVSRTSPDSLENLP